MPAGGLVEQATGETHGRKGPFNHRRMGGSVWVDAFGHETRQGSGREWAAACYVSKCVFGWVSGWVERGTPCTWQRHVVACSGDGSVLGKGVRVACRGASNLRRLAAAPGSSLKAAAALPAAVAATADSLVAHCGSAG